jgi:PPP family 3-phenylpropionic acid transporter
MDDARRFQAIYFVTFAAFSGFEVYRNVFFQELGLTPTQMGVLGALFVAGGVAAQPVWGVVADYTRSPTRVLTIGASLSAVALSSYLLVESLPAVFLVVAVGTTVFAVMEAPLLPVSNALLVSRGYNYAFTRSFGSLSFGATALVLGWVLTRTAVDAVVYVYIAGMAILVALLRGVPRVDERVFEGSLSRKAARLVRQPRYLLVVVAAFVLGGVSFAGAAFFSVYMRSVGLGDGLTGVAWATKTVAEVVVFLALSRLDRRHGIAVLLAGLGYAIGYATLSWFPTLLPVLGANLALGAGVALVYFALVNLAHDCAPEGLESTAQTLVTSIGIGVGGVIGEVTVGRLVAAVGVQFVYRYLAVAALALVLCGALIVGANRRYTTDG